MKKVDRQRDEETRQQDEELGSVMKRLGNRTKRLDNVIETSVPENVAARNETKP